MIKAPGIHLDAGLENFDFRLEPIEEKKPTRISIFPGHPDPIGEQVIFHCRFREEAELLCMAIRQGHDVLQVRGCGHADHDFLLRCCLGARPDLAALGARSERLTFFAIAVFLGDVCFLGIKLVADLRCFQLTIAVVIAGFAGKSTPGVNSAGFVNTSSMPWTAYSAASPIVGRKNFTRRIASTS